ncbi:hypothetical protein HDU98_010516, partial [Podochytrium sp. JEL0797]
CEELIRKFHARANLAASQAKADSSSSTKIPAAKKTTSKPSTRRPNARADSQVGDGAGGGASGGVSGEENAMETPVEKTAAGSGEESRSNDKDEEEEDRLKKSVKLIDNDATKKAPFTEPTPTKEDNVSNADHQTKLTVAAEGRPGVREVIVIDDDDDNKDEVFVLERRNEDPEGCKILENWLKAVKKGDSRERRVILAKIKDVIEFEKSFRE